MTGEAQRYINDWKTLAFVAGLFAIVGVCVGLYGTLRSWKTLRLVRELRSDRTLNYLGLGDVVMLGLLTCGSIAQVATSAGLIWLAARYPDHIATVLVALDGDVTRVYGGYVLQVLLWTLVVPSYLTIRALALLSEEVRWAQQP